MTQPLFALRNVDTGQVHEIDDEAINELASCLQYARDQQRATLIFRSMRVDCEVAAKIINDSI